MTRILFIGLGQMGGNMANNLASGGHYIAGFDQNPDITGLHPNMNRLSSLNQWEFQAGDVVFLSLPSGGEVRAICTEIIPQMAKDSLIIDCSTTDVATARAMDSMARQAHLHFIDAPVSGGVMGAKNATLTLMVGADAPIFARVEPLLQAIGKIIIHCGAVGNGQSAKIINNMMLSMQMIAVCEGFVLAEKLGLPAEKLFQVSSQSSGQCWSLTTYAPVAGLVANAPSNRQFQGGFASAMMLKDCALADKVKKDNNLTLPLSEQALHLYQQMVNEMGGQIDFSAMIQYLQKINPQNYHKGVSNE